MAEITASMVKELREATGLGMMDCKKALAETDGDFKAAEELLRIKSGAKASKAASRVAAEGVVGVFISADGKTGALVEVNCETDFVARNASFVSFVARVVIAIGCYRGLRHRPHRRGQDDRHPFGGIHLLGRLPAGDLPLPLA
jgi:translation elongation factor Ts